jgi:DNA-binding MarR family transcriptional regulator
MEHGLHDDIGYWLRRLSDLVHKSFEEKVARHGMTLPQWRVLIALYNGDATNATELARFIAVDRALISRTVFDLEEGGFLGRTRQKDRRREKLELTSKGREVTVKLALAAKQNEREFFQQLTSTQRSQLHLIIANLLKEQGIIMGK